MKLFRVYVFILIIQLAYLPVFCQNNLALAQIKKELQAIESENPSIKIGFSLFSPSGKIVLDYKGNEKLIPASTLKIYTTGAALMLLGEKYRYNTFLEFSGFISNCRELNGDLIIRGTGDPTLGSEKVEGVLPYPELFNLLSQEVQKAGITKIKGNIIGDNSYFVDCLTPTTWPLKDVANYFGAGPSGLTLNENSYKLIFKPGKTVGSKTEIIGTNPPFIPGLFYENKVTTYFAGSGDRAVIMENPLDVKKEVIGTIPAGVSTFTIRGSIPDPALLASELLREKLENQGVLVEGRCLTGFNNTKKDISRFRNILFTYSSPPLIEIISQTNSRSHNLFAETLLITLGKEFRGAGNYESGFSVTKDFWVGKGVNMNSVEIFDGSGLSPDNRISPITLSTMLAVLKEEKTFDLFLNTLPIAGVSGTVKNFCRSTSAKGEVYVKSGSIEDVLSYSGYAVSKSGKFLPFSIMINGHMGSRGKVIKSIEKIMVILTDSP